MRRHDEGSQAMMILMPRWVGKYVNDRSSRRNIVALGQRIDATEVMDSIEVTATRIGWQRGHKLINVGANNP